MDEHFQDKHKEQKKDNEYSLGEAQRQITTLWQKYTDLFVETANNGKELAQIKAQNDYIVKLLEKIDACNQNALPRCAERGVKISNLEVDVGNTTITVVDMKSRLEKLESTANVLRWVAAIISGVLVILIAGSLNK